MILKSWKGQHTGHIRINRQTVGSEVCVYQHTGGYYRDPHYALLNGVPADVVAMDDVSGYEPYGKRVNDVHPTTPGKVIPV